MALADARKNFAQSLVATAPSPATSGTSLVVTGGDGTKFPAASFNAVVCPANAQPTTTNAEIVRVTGVSTDTFTITRAVESTSARTIVVGDRIYTSLTAVDYPGPGLVGSITTIQPDDAAAAGTSETYARADHKHAIDATTAATLTGTNAEGSSTTSFARADHNHAFPTWGQVAGYIPLAAPVSTATGGTNTWFALNIKILHASTLTGVEWKNGATVNGNARSMLFDASSTKVAELTTSTAQSGTNVRQRLAFDGTYSAAPGSYFVLLWFTSATATAFMAPVLGAVGATGVTSTPAALSSFTIADMTATSLPMMRAY